MSLCVSPFISLSVSAFLCIHLFVSFCFSPPTIPIPDHILTSDPLCLPSPFLRVCPSLAPPSRHLPLPPPSKLLPAPPLFPFLSDKPAPHTPSLPDTCVRRLSHTHTPGGTSHSHARAHIPSHHLPMKRHPHTHTMPMHSPPPNASAACPGSGRKWGRGGVWGGGAEESGKDGGYPSTLALCSEHVARYYFNKLSTSCPHTSCRTPSPILWISFISR